MPQSDVRWEWGWVAALLAKVAAGQRNPVARLVVEALERCGRGCRATVAGGWCRGAAASGSGVGVAHWPRSGVV